MADPLILTLRLDAPTFARLDAERQAHFPDRGYRLPAHLTLFHALPGEALAEIGLTLAEIARRTPVLPLAFTSVIDLRPGAAYRVESPDLTALRATLAARWASWLSRQDAAGWRPHSQPSKASAPASCCGTTGADLGSKLATMPSPAG